MISLKYSVLNALRHQRNWNFPPPAVLKVSSISVLNALRHQRNWNAGKRGISRLALACSTPYGIKGIGTLPVPPLTEWMVMCSTPYGIKGIGTTYPPPQFRAEYRCAQRLTASKELELMIQNDSRWELVVLNALRHQRNWNLGATATANNSRWCSTPYGIKGIGTGRATVNVLTPQSVLNALRHQRNWNSLIGWGTLGRLGGAQRLTASKELELQTGSPSGKGNRVLNALRHQRNWNRATKVIRERTG